MSIQATVCDESKIDANRRRQREEPCHDDDSVSLYPQRTRFSFSRARYTNVIVSNFLSLFLLLLVGCCEGNGCQAHVCTLSHEETREDSRDAAAAAAASAAAAADQLLGSVSAAATVFSYSHQKGIHVGFFLLL